MLTGRAIRSTYWKNPDDYMIVDKDGLELCFNHEDKLTGLGFRLFNDADCEEDCFEITHKGKYRTGNITKEEALKLKAWV